MEPIFLDVAGCSDISERAHEPGLQRVPELFRLRAFCDPDPEKLSAFGKRYGITRLYTSVPEMLAALPEGALLNTTPTREHARVAIAALDAGRDVLSEKPMALSPAEADRMIEAANRNGRVLQLCFMSRFAPAWIKIRELLDSGEIGELLSVTMTQYWEGGHDLNTNWRTDAAVSGGGIIADSAAHWIDILRWLAGEIDAVSAIGRSLPGTPVPVDDTAAVLFRFRSGTIGILRNSWHHLRPDNEAETVELYGTRGTILGNLQTPWKEGGIQTVRLVRPDRTTSWSFHDPMQRFANQLAAFGELIRNRTPEKSNASDGRRALAIQCGIYEAMNRRIWVENFES